MLASMGVDAGSIVGVVIGLGLAAVFMWWWTRNTFASNPSSVLRRLHKSGTEMCIRDRPWRSNRASSSTPSW